LFGIRVISIGGYVVGWRIPPSLSLGKGELKSCLSFPTCFIGYIVAWRPGKMAGLSVGGTGPGTETSGGLRVFVWFGLFRDFEIGHNRLGLFSVLSSHSSTTLNFISSLPFTTRCFDSFVLFYTTLFSLLSFFVART